MKKELSFKDHPVAMCARIHNMDIMRYQIDMPISLTKVGHQKKVGQMSNLLTDMIHSGTCTDEELFDAIEHSLVILDAIKHRLDYKKSEEDHHIKELIEKYRVRRASK